MSDEEIDTNASTLRQQYEELVRLRERLVKFEAIIRNGSIFNGPDNKKQSTPDNEAK